MLPRRFIHTNDHRRLSLTAYAFLMLLSLACFVPGIISMPPTDRDESLYAQASKQMIETGNYIDIRYQEQPRYKKPIGIYWAQVVAVQLFNPDHLNEIWAYRLPSLLGATLSVMLTAAIGAVLFSPITGFFAALMLASCLLLNVEARLAKTDAALLAATLSMLYGLAKAYMSTRPLSWAPFLALWIGLGASLLIKGPMALIILLGLLLWLRITTRDLSWLKNIRLAFGLPLLLVLTLPWFLTIILQSNGSFLNESAGQDLLKKIWHGQGGFRPPGMHALVMPLLFFPASLFVLLALPDIWRNRTEPSVRFCLGWILPFWLVFELSSTKLPHYVLPAYPAIALLAAKALLDRYPALHTSDDTPRLLWPTLSVLIWLLIGSGLAVSTILLPHIMGQQGVDYLQIGAGFLLHLLMAGTLLMLLYHRDHAIVLTTCAGIVFLGITLGNMLPNFPHLWLARDVRNAVHTAHLACTPHYLASGYSEPSFIFLTDTTTQLFNAPAPLADAFLKDPCPIAVLPHNRVDAFLSHAREHGVQPQALNEITGYNMGAGRMTSLHLYRK